MKNAYWWPDINFFLKITKIEISSHSLTHSLPDDSRKPRAQMKQRMATILRHNNKLISEMPFGVPTSVGPLHLIVPFIVD